MDIYKDSSSPVLVSISSVIVPTGWSFVAISFSSTTLLPTYYNSLATASLLTPGVNGSIASKSAPSCTNLKSNFIGKVNHFTPGYDVLLAAALNDVKIYNTALSYNQLKVFFLSEKSI